MRKLFLILAFPLLAACGAGDKTPEPSFVVKYGLGEAETAHVSNDRTYAWYVDQSQTGPYSSINCGPACTSMAGKWALGSFATTAYMRTASEKTGWWSTTDVYDFLGNGGADRYYADYSEAVMRAALDGGDIVILCLDIYYVRAATGNKEYRKDKFYTTGSKKSGHFVVVKGYREVDGKLLMEMYDPWGMGAKYADGMPKGRDRYYRIEDLTAATDVWWKYMIVVSEAAVRGGARPWRALDPATVPVAWGS